MKWVLNNMTNSYYTNIKEIVWVLGYTFKNMSQNVNFGAHFVHASSDTVKY